MLGKIAWIVSALFFPLLFQAIFVFVEQYSKFADFNAYFLVHQYWILEESRRRL